MITVITPTRDRPAGFNLCRQWMKRQTVWSEIEWIVVDDGDKPVGSGSEYRYFRLPPSKNKYTNFHNLKWGLQNSHGEVVMYIEDDDWIASNYVEAMVENVSGHSAAATSGALVYHVGYRKYFDKRCSPEEARRRLRFMGSFCVASEGIEVLRKALDSASLVEDPLIDLRFWSKLVESGLLFNVFSGFYIVNIKGIPGRSITWKHGADMGTDDPDEKYLRGLIGDEDTDKILKASEGWEEWIPAWKEFNLKKKKT